MEKRIETYRLILKNADSYERYRLLTQLDIYFYEKTKKPKLPKIPLPKWLRGDKDEHSVVKSS